MFEHLKKNGVLGMNRRIGQYISRYNPRKFYPLVDDKIKSYEQAKIHNIPMPDHFFNIRRFGDLKWIPEKLKGTTEFVVKPAHGSTGNGILIVENMEWNDDPRLVTFHTTRKNVMDLKTFRYYLSDILSGLYSLNGQPDQVIIQEKLKIHPSLDPYCYKGIPDIRVIVFRGFPVMAMIRLPTKSSGGRANLHQGAVGCGIDILYGQVTHAICRNRAVEVHPDTGHIFNDLTIAYWPEVLLTAAKCYEVSHMGYLGIDIVLTPDKGPLLLEMNARPGLSIQTANMKGLYPLLEIIRKAPDKLSPEQRVAYSMEVLAEPSKQSKIGSK